MILPKNNHGFSVIPIMVFLAIFSVIGFGVSQYLNTNNNESNVLAAVAGTSVVDCIQNPGLAECKNSIQTPQVNPKFCQGCNDTQPPRSGGGGGGGGGDRDICEIEPGGQKCADWLKFKNYCAEFGDKNKDPNCNALLGTNYQDPNIAWTTFCRSSLGKYDNRCIQNGIYCSANPSDAVCNTSSNTPGTTVTPKVVTPTPIPNPTNDEKEVEKGYCAANPNTSICSDGRLTQEELLFICKAYPSMYGCPKIKLPNPAPVPTGQADIRTSGNCPSYTVQVGINNATGVKTCKLKDGVTVNKNNCPNGTRILAYNNMNGNFICQVVALVTPTPTATPAPTPAVISIKENCPAYSTFVRSNPVTGANECRLNAGIILVNGNCPAGYGVRDDQKLNGQTVCQIKGTGQLQACAQYSVKGLTLQVLKKYECNNSAETGTYENVAGASCTYVRNNPPTHLLPRVCSVLPYYQVGSRTAVKCTVKGSEIYSQEVDSCSVPADVYRNIHGRN